MITLWVICLVNQFFRVASHQEKYYIYIHSDNWWSIAIIIGAQAQHVNVTSNSVQLRMRSFPDRTSNFLLRKVFSQPPPPLQGILQLQDPVTLGRSQPICSHFWVSSQRGDMRTPKHPFLISYLIVSTLTLWF